MAMVDAGKAQGAFVISFKHNGRTVRQALAAACAAAGVLLAGCGASNSTSSAQKASQDAAARTVSAGEPRATDKLMAETGGDMNALEARLKSQATGGTIGDYVIQNGADKDLDASIKQLQAAITADTPPAIKSGLQAQLGSIQLSLAEHRLGLLQADLIDLNQQAAEVQTLAQSAAELYAQAAALEKGSKAPTSAEADKARAAVTADQKALAAAQAKVAALKDQITQKEAAARQIYAATDAAFTAADGQKGQAAIAAGNKAMEDRKQAERLMADAGNLAPQLAGAQAELDLAQVHLDSAEKTAQLTQAAYDQGKAAADQAAARVTALKAAAVKIAGDAGKADSLAGRCKTFLELAGKLDVQVRNAAAPADAANSSFAAAATAQTAYINDTLKKADEAGLAPDDPLRKALKDERTGPLLAWSQSAAQQQAGRALLAGAQAFDLIAATTRAAAAAKVANEAKGTLDGKWCRDEAAKRFQGAADIAKAADNRSTSDSSDLGRIKWIGLSLETTANYGLYLAGNAGALNLAKAAKTAAVTRNPNLEAQLDWIK